MSDEKKGADVLSLITGGATDDKLAEALRNVEKQWPNEVKMAELFAKLARVKYDAFKLQNFNDVQALQLTMKALWP